MAGHPDFQAFPQWLGDPLVQNAALAIGNGSHADTGINVSNFASVIVAIKPTGGGITATLKQTIHNGPAALVISTQWTVAVGVVTFEQIVLQGSIVELDLQGDTGGETVAYALYGSNTASSAQVSSVNVVNFLHNGVLVKAEPGLDLVDSAAAAVGKPSMAWTAVDNGGVSVQYTPVFTAGPTLLDYTQATGNVTVSATTEGAATTIVTGGAFTPDGSTPVMVEFFSPGCDAGAATYDLSLVLYQDGSSIGVMSETITANAATVRQGLYVKRRITPTNASHTYSIRGFRGATNVTVRAGAGGSGNTMPMFIRCAYDI